MPRLTTHHDVTNEQVDVVNLLGLLGHYAYIIHCNKPESYTVEQRVPGFGIRKWTISKEDFHRALQDERVQCVRTSKEKKVYQLVGLKP